MSDTQATIRVLLVDDEIYFLESTAKALRRRGFDVTTAVNGIDALNICRVDEFEVAILDVKMPGLDGHRLYHALHAKLPDMKIIMLTGHGDIQKAFDLGKHGLATYLSKPIEISELEKYITDAIHQQPDPTASNGDTSNETKVLPPIRVLLVDDEEEFLASTKKVLARRGLEVRTATGGHAALKLLDTQRFEVAVVDVKMPGIDGMTLLEHMKSTFPLMEVVLLTGHANVSLAVEGMKLGAYDYLSKPQETDELVRTIKAAAEKRREASREAQEAWLKEIIEKTPS